MTATEAAGQETSVHERFADVYRRRREEANSAHFAMMDAHSLLRHREERADISERNAQRATRLHGMGDTALRIDNTNRFNSNNVCSDPVYELLTDLDNMVRDYAFRRSESTGDERDFRRVVRGLYDSIADRTMTRETYTSLLDGTHPVYGSMPEGDDGYAVRDIKAVAKALGKMRPLAGEITGWHGEQA